MSDQIEIRVPDIGDFKDVPVIEVLVKPGDHVKKNDSLITLESEKASMEVPSNADGTIAELKVKVGDTVSQGTVIATLTPELSSRAEQPQATESRETPSAQAPVPQTPVSQVPATQPSVAQTAATQPPQPIQSQQMHAQATADLSSRAQQPQVAEPREVPQPSSDGISHASPSIRRFARELGVALGSVRGSGPNGRITREDVQHFVKAALQAPRQTQALPFDLPSWPKVDFAQYGPIERKPLPRIKRIAGPNLHRNWLQIPHITNYDEADVTAIEKFRRKINREQESNGGTRLTMLSFLIKASVAALEHFPEFNSSLDGTDLIYKRYYHIGFAADTPNGLVVPVIKDAAKKGLIEIAREAAEMAAKARNGKLTLTEMSGGTFTVSSIGSIGGTQFTQIVNAPEVAILGATRATTRPVWRDKKFVPRLILPLSVSYDHRVIDGAAAARFLVFIADALADFRRVML